jgi:hypothetical protein
MISAGGPSKQVSMMRSIKDAGEHADVEKTTTKKRQTLQLGEHDHVDKRTGEHEDLE